MAQRSRRDSGEFLTIRLVSPLSNVLSPKSGGILGEKGMLLGDYSSIWFELKYYSLMIKPAFGKFILKKCRKNVKLSSKS